MNTKSRVRGTNALLLAAPLLIFHFLVSFLPMFSEQIKTGWGYGTNIEMGALILWLLQGISLVPIALAAVFIVLAIVNKDHHWKIVLSGAFLAGTVLSIALSNLFLFF